MSIPYIIGVVSTIGSVLHGEPLHSLLSLLKHARASIGGEIQLLHHHVLWNTDLLPQVQTSWHNVTDKCVLISDYIQCPFAFSKWQHQSREVYLPPGFRAAWHGIS